jgi:hemolysin III
MSTAAKHYPTPLARRADLAVHLAGLTLAVFGGGLALGLAVSRGILGQVAAVSVFAFGLIAMFSFSMAYNFARPKQRAFRQRLDHAGIFLMIATSYTPFTTQALDGAWAMGMTIAVWTMACVGIVGKLVLPNINKSIWIFVYIGLSWLILIAIKPMSEAIPTIAIWLLALGGITYTIGTILFAHQHIKFWRAIWHGHVVAGAGLHYAAMIIGVVLAGSK